MNFDQILRIHCLLIVNFIQNCVWKAWAFYVNVQLNLTNRELKMIFNRIQLGQTDIITAYGTSCHSLFITQGLTSTSPLK